MMNLIFLTLIDSWIIRKKWQEQHIAKYMREITLDLAGEEEYVLEYI
jgi:hypothetical protein